MTQLDPLTEEERAALAARHGTVEFAATPVGEFVLRKPSNYAEAEPQLGNLLFGTATEKLKAVHWYALRLSVRPMSEVVAKMLDEAPGLVVHFVNPVVRLIAPTADASSKK